MYGDTPVHVVRRGRRGRPSLRPRARRKPDPLRARRAAAGRSGLSRLRARPAGLRPVGQAAPRVFDPLAVGRGLRADGPSRASSARRWRATRSAGWSSPMPRCTIACRVERLVLISSAGLFQMPLPISMGGAHNHEARAGRGGARAQRTPTVGKARFEERNEKVERFIEQAVTRPDALSCDDLARVMWSLRQDLTSYHLFDEVRPADDADAGHLRRTR